MVHLFLPQEEIQIQRKKRLELYDSYLNLAQITNQTFWANRVAFYEIWNDY